MGQQQLNCKNNAKDEGKEITTSQSNALLLMRNHQQSEEPSELKSKKQTTVRSDVEPYTPSRTSTATHPRQANTTAPIPNLPQHENILKVSSRQFRGAERAGSRWSQKRGSSLAEIVEGRYNSNMHFPQTQVAILIESLTYALAYMQKNSCRHHDFYPTNIFYQQGVFKVTNPALIQASAYELTQRRQRFSFLAPELIAEIIEDTPADEVPPPILYKADLFAIGMILLEFCSLEQSSQCYDEENYSLVDKVIRTRLAKIAKLYSPSIADCIAQMLKYDVDERVDPEELAVTVFLNAPQEKVDKEPPPPPPQQERRTSNEQQPPQAQPPAHSHLQKQHQLNPPHVQQQYLMVPGQGAQPPPQPGGQGMPIGGNNIALPTPNYTYSYIGPNNQSLLSANTLHNKLRIIEKINQTPIEEEESEGIPSHLTSNIPSHISSENHPTQRIVVQQNQLPPNHPQIQQLHQQIQQQRIQGPPPPQQPQQLHPQQLPPQHLPPQQPPQQHPPQIPVQLPPQQLLQPPQNPNYPPSVRTQPQPPPVAQNYPPPQKPSSPPIPSITTSADISKQSSSLSYEDRLLLMQPTYYEVHGKNGQQPTNDNYKPSYEPKKWQPNQDVSDKYNFKPTVTVPENDKYRMTEPSYDKHIPSYQSGYKYSTPTDYSAGTKSATKLNQADQNGETLEQRVDRILQISRNIK